MPEGDGESENDDSELQRSRTEVRRATQKSETELMKLSDWLASRSDRVLVKLELSEDMLFAIHGARRMENPSARKRALRLVRTELRDIDVDALRRKIEDLAYVSRTESQAAADDWAARLIAGGDVVTNAFMDAFPSADRQRVRQLVRNAKKAPEAKAATAKSSLSKGLHEYVARAAAPPADEAMDHEATTDDASEPDGSADEVT